MKTKDIIPDNQLFMFPEMEIDEIHQPIRHRQTASGKARSTSSGTETANSLTNKIIKHIKQHGGQAERITIQGRQIQTATGTKWIKSHMTVGTADISAIVNGRAVKIEVKIGTDRQSEEQRQYQADVERAGGLYYIARTFDSFLSWYNQIKNTCDE